MRDQGTRQDSGPPEGSAEWMQSVLDALTGGTGKITSEVAVVRGCALLTTLCRLTSDPPAAPRFAIAGLTARCAELEAKPDPHPMRVEPS